MLAFKLLLKLFNNINFDITLGRYKPQGNVVDLFSGQGSQYLEIGRELAINFPVLQQTYNQINNLFCKAGLSPISEKVFPAPVFDIVQRQTQAKVLQQTEVSQPAIAASGVLMYKTLQNSGFKPDIVAGHSFGELTALWAGSVLSDEDYFYLVKERGQAMAKPTDSHRDTGAMLAVSKTLFLLQDLRKAPLFKGGWGDLNIWNTILSVVPA